MQTNKNKERNHKTAALPAKKRENFSKKKQQEAPVVLTQVSEELPNDVVIGRNAVTEAIKSGRSINKILIAKGERQGSIKELIALAKDAGIMMQEAEYRKLDEISGGLRHQGVVAYGAPVDYVELDDILRIAEDKGEPPFLILLDELEDPHNLGAILRTADAVGVHGVLIPKRRSCPLSATVAKTSAGAMEYVPVARIGNVAQTIKLLKEKNIWAVGADMDGDKDYYESDLTGALLLVVGSEGKGISRLAKEQCDFLVKIPMHGKINSLNASVASSILLYESLKQRQIAAK